MTNRAFRRSIGLLGVLLLRQRLDLTVEPREIAFPAGIIRGKLG